ncbi:TrbL/VirB6 family protein [Leisingera caerulea]|uniref:type IV secretion system protein n=1 Tax=Leisingera caerulea TaxID=506591 RepID=UPI0004879BA9|nr:type IV secretion system protein [Leisingera caerulea]
MWDWFFSQFTSSIADTTNTIAGKMSGALAAPLAAAMTLYIVLYGFAIMRGMIQEPVMDFLARGIKLAIIWSLVSGVGGYTSWVSNTILTDTPAFVTGITGGRGNNPADSVMAHVTDLGVRAEEEAGSGISGSITGSIQNLVIMAYGAIFSAVALFVAVITHFGLAIMAAIGPLFICFALFDVSRGWFFSWLGQTVNFAVLKLLVVVVMTIIVDFLAKVITKTSGVDALTAMMNYAVALTCGMLFFFLLPSIASALTAGTGASTGALQRVVERKLLGSSSSGGGNSTHSGSATRT